jgi:hypothetical protein
VVRPVEWRLLKARLAAGAWRPPSGTPARPSVAPAHAEEGARTVGRRRLFDGTLLEASRLEPAPPGPAQPQPAKGA